MIHLRLCGGQSEVDQSDGGQTDCRFCLMEQQYLFTDFEQFILLSIGIVMSFFLESAGNWSCFNLG